MKSHLPQLLRTTLCVLGLYPKGSQAAEINPSLSELELKFIPRIFTNEFNQTLPYRLFIPKGYNPTNKYPLTVFLHGSGESGIDNRIQLINCGPGVLSDNSVQDKFPSFVLAPQCPLGKSWGYYGNNSSPAALLTELVHALLLEFKIDINRIYLTGLSLGGMGTLYGIAKDPDLYAAAVPVCSAGDSSIAPLFKKIPIWAFHGTADQNVPLKGFLRASQPSVVGALDMINAVNANGGNAKITQYQGKGHDIWCTAYNEPELMPWLFAQKKISGSTRIERSRLSSIPTNYSVERNGGTLSIEFRTKKNHSWRIIDSKGQVRQTTQGQVPHLYRVDLSALPREAHLLYINEDKLTAPPILITP